jgi:hypothetical protein
LKPIALSKSAAAAIVLFAAAFALSTLAQAPQGAPPPAGGPPPHDHMHMPPPTNLKVLPKDLTSEQLHTLMHGWSDALGVHCTTCHAENPKDIGPDGHPRLNYADDSKQDKSTARLMYKMTQDINRNYVSKVEGAEATVTCGTCHRGHLEPETFVPPKHAPPPPPPPAN